MRVGAVHTVLIQRSHSKVLKVHSAGRDALVCRRLIIDRGYLTMKKIILALLSLSLLISVPVFAAGEGCQTEELLSKLRASSDVLVTEGAYEVDRTLLFYQFSTVLVAGADFVEFEATLDGGSLFLEQITLREHKPLIAAGPVQQDLGGSVVELLALDPARRAQLRRTEKTSDGEVELVLRLNGEVFETLSLAELESRTTALQQDMPTPHALSSNLSSDAVQHRIADPVAAKGACENQCVAEETACHNACGGPPFSCHLACDDDYEQCLDDCVPATCTPKTTTTQSFVLISETFIGGPTCVQDRRFFAPYPIDFYFDTRRVFRVTTTTTTTHANCSTTTSQSVANETSYCWTFAFPGSCFAPLPSSNFCW